MVGEAFRRYTRLVIDRKRRNGEFVYNYGGTNAIEDDNLQPAVWCLESWFRGADGILPWQTVGKGGSWH